MKGCQVAEWGPHPCTAPMPSGDPLLGCRAPQGHPEASPHQHHGRAELLGQTGWKSQALQVAEGILEANRIWGFREQEVSGASLLLHPL